MSEFKVKSLQGEALEWVQIALAFGFDLDHVVRCFIDFFPEYRDPKEYESVSEQANADAKVFGDLRTRFRKMQTDIRRISYFKIKENKETLRKFLDKIPIASPLTQLIELEKMRIDTTLKPNERIKAILAANKITNILLFDGGSNSFDLMPTLPKASEQAEPDDTNDTEDVPKKKKNLGGAMMSNANSG